MDWFKRYENEIMRSGDGKVVAAAENQMVVTMFVLDAPKFEPSIVMTKDEFVSMCREYDTDGGFDMNGFKQHFVNEFARGCYEGGNWLAQKPSEIPVFEEPEYNPDESVDFSEFGIEL